MQAYLIQCELTKQRLAYSNEFIFFYLDFNVKTFTLHTNLITTATVMQTHWHFLCHGLLLLFHK